MKEYALRWMIIVGYVILMYVSTCILKVFKVLENNEIASVVFYVLYIGAAVVLVAWGLKRFGIRSDYAWLYLGILTVLLLLAMQNLPETQKRLHFLEYGLLFFLVYRAMKGSFDAFVVYGLALIITSAFGVADELLQSLYDREGIIIGDMMNDTFAGFLAAGVMLVWERC